MPDRYAWLGVSRRRQVRDIVSACLETWLQDWSIRRGAITPELDEIPDAAGMPLEAEILQLRGEEGCLAIAIDRGALGMLGSELASTSISDRSGVTAEIGYLAVRDLLVSLAARAGEACAEVIAHEEPWPDSAIRPELGALRLLVKFKSLEFQIALSRIWVERLCPAPVHTSPASIPLSTREISMMPTRVRLTAVLDFGAVDALELAGLTVDDVLVSERRLGHPVDVRAGEKTLFKAMVCREGNHLALVAQNITALAEKP